LGLGQGGRIGFRVRVRLGVRIIRLKLGLVVDIYTHGIYERSSTTDISD
jgi:hypothetical protein